MIGEIIQALTTSKVVMRANSIGILNESPFHRMVNLRVWKQPVVGAFTRPLQYLARREYSQHAITYIPLGIMI